jgi:hypothetical protein
VKDRTRGSVQHGSHQRDVHSIDRPIVHGMDEIAEIWYFSMNATNPYNSVAGSAED